MKRLAVLCLLALSAGTIPAQVITGSITGTVVDPTGGVIPGAVATLISDATKESRNNTANASGIFNFTAVQPGTYVVRIEHAGFKTSEQRGVTVAATDHVSLGEVQLQVG